MKVIADSDLPTGTRPTCWEVASFEGNDTGGGFPTAARLARARGLKGIVSERTAHAEVAGCQRMEIRNGISVLDAISIPAIS